MEPILILKKIRFRYEDSWILKDVDLRINEGEMLGVLGPNGSGKSTLLKVMDGVLLPQQGEVLLRGRPLTSLPRTDVAREIAMVAQENFLTVLSQA